jgi:hypothetical protein
MDCMHTGFLLTSSLLALQSPLQNYIRWSSYTLFFHSLYGFRNLFNRFVRVFPILLCGWVVYTFLLPEDLLTYDHSVLLWQIADSHHSSHFNCGRAITKTWKNLLFVDNLQYYLQQTMPHPDGMDVCMNWTWSLSMQMQVIAHSLHCL